MLRIGWKNGVETLCWGFWRGIQVTLIFHLGRFARQKGHSWKPKGPQSHRNCGPFASLFGLFQACFQPPNRVNKIQSTDSLYFKNFAQNRVFETRRVVRWEYRTYEGWKSIICLTKPCIDLDTGFWQEERVPASGTPSFSPVNVMGRTPRAFFSYY